MKVIVRKLPIFNLILLTVIKITKCATLEFLHDYCRKFIFLAENGRLSMTYMLLLCVLHE